MTFDPSITKIVVIFLIGIIFFAVTIFRPYSVSVTNRFSLIFFSFLLIVIHFLVFGTSDSIETNEQLISGLAIMTLTFWASNALRDWDLFIKPMNFIMILAILFVYINMPIAILDNNSSYIEGNYTGITSNANILGGYLAIFCMPALLFGLMRSKSLNSRAFYIFTMLICGYIILITRSRGAILSISVAAIFVVITTDNIKYRTKVFFTSTIFLGAIAGFIQASGKYADLDLSATRDPLLNQRITAIAERPWTGWGFNSDVYNFYYQENAFPAMEKGNTILQIFEEFGLPFGTAISIGIIYLFINTALGVRKTPVGFAFASTLIGSLAHLMFETWLFNFQSFLSIYVWIILLLYAQLKINGLSSDLQRQANR